MPKKVFKSIKDIKLPTPKPIVVKPVQPVKIASYKCPTCRTIYKIPVKDGLYSAHKVCAADHSLMEAVIIYE